MFRRVELLAVDDIDGTFRSRKRTADIRSKHRLSREHKTGGQRFVHRHARGRKPQRLHRPSPDPSKCFRLPDLDTWPQAFAQHRRRAGRCGRPVVGPAGDVPDVICRRKEMRRRAPLALCVGHAVGHGTDPDMGHAVGAQGQFVDGFQLFVRLLSFGTYGNGRLCLSHLPGWIDAGQ